MRRRRILVVEDQDPIRSVLQEALTQAGAEVWAASDGEAALEMVDAALPQLILLDLAMPGLQGWDVVGKLQASRSTAAIPVVLQTSADDFVSFDRARKQGVSAFISKPFRLGEVVETCRRVLDGARPLQGTPDPEALKTLVQVLDPARNLLAQGTLVEVGPQGGQVALDRALTVGHSIILRDLGGRDLLSPAEVRWVSWVDGRYYHGLASPRD